MGDHTSREDEARRKVEEEVKKNEAARDAVFGNFLLGCVNTGIGLVCSYGLGRVLGNQRAIISNQKALMKSIDEWGEYHTTGLNLIRSESITVRDVIRLATSEQIGETIAKNAVTQAG